MKSFLVLFCLIFSAHVEAQVVVTAGVIELPDSQVLYRGIDNNVSVTVVNLQTDQVILSGQNVQISYVEGPDYTVRPGSGKSAVLMVRCQDGDSTIEIGRRYYDVFNLPDPNLFWGDKKETYHVFGDELSRKLEAKYPEGIEIEADFTVTRWVLYYKDERVEGIGSNLSTANEFLKTVESRTPVTIIATVLGPDGILRRISGAWLVN